MDNGVRMGVLDLSGNYIENQFPMRVGLMIVFQDVPGHHFPVLVMNHREADCLVGMPFRETGTSSGIAKIAVLLLNRVLRNYGSRSVSTTFPTKSVPQGCFRASGPALVVHRFQWEEKGT